MSLTFGIGPLTKAGRARLNVDLSEAPAHLIYIHDVDRRIRGVVGGETVVDTRRARMLHETGLLPQWYVPLEDVRSDLLTTTTTTTHCPFKGDASYWTLRVGDRVEEDALWAYRTPKPEVAAIEGYAAFYFDRLDEWYEEDEKLLGRHRDPFHRVDTRWTSRHVVVRAGDLVVADTTRPIALFETGLPVRYYIPPEDVRADLLAPSETTSVCPYKGVAGYQHVRAGDKQFDDSCWGYAEPLGEALAVAGYLSFLGDGIEISVD